MLIQTPHQIFAADCISLGDINQYFPAIYPIYVKTLLN